jgi:DNA polymerase-3 subunit epsilon
MGMQDYSKFTDGEKSNKTKPAETLIQGGQELEIISENVFYELVLQDA